MRPFLSFKVIHNHLLLNKIQEWNQSCRSQSNALENMTHIRPIFRMDLWINAERDSIFFFLIQSTRSRISAPHVPNALHGSMQSQHGCLPGYMVSFDPLLIMLRCCFLVCFECVWDRDSSEECFVHTAYITGSSYKKNCPWQSSWKKVLSVIILAC